MIDAPGATAGLDGDKLDREAFVQMVLTLGGERRFTQDTPIMPDVWTEYAAAPSDPARKPLILTVHYRSSAFAIGKRLAEKFKARGTLREAKLSALRTDIAADLTFEELIVDVLPMTAWWQDRFVKAPDGSAVKSLAEIYGAYRGPLSEKMDDNLHDALRKLSSRDKWHVLFLMFLVHYLRAAGTNAALVNDLVRKINERTAKISDFKGLWIDSYDEFIGKLIAASAAVPENERIHTVNRNRPFRISTYQSRLAVKADAAEKVFSRNASEIVWAVVDTGIDRDHPAFQDRSAPTPPPPATPPSRVVAAYDFTRLRQLVSYEEPDEELRKTIESIEGGPAKFDTIKQDLADGRRLDWEFLKPLLEIKPGAKEYVPVHPHGTHVAGIIGGDLKKEDLPGSRLGDIAGVCPTIKLYDLRVCGEDGGGEEWVVIAALQFVVHLNRDKSLQLVHGVNLSLSIAHAVANFACGQTPICVQAEQLVNDGVVVVAAAGNLGYQKFATAGGVYESYSAMNITDPGNADGVITVGATHKEKPHTYGVSYFSSRGPTGDGRAKPDLIAPGEGIWAPVPGKKIDKMDGTSMAAPHVSGAAAMLMARHVELRGNPRRVKSILCKTATDLGRERNFQGAGLLDILRALQSV